MSSALRSLAAVYYPPDNHLEVFFVDQQGVLCVVRKVQNGPWQGTEGLTEPGFAPAGAPVAAVVYPSHQQFEVFVVDTHGALQVLWKVGNNENWQGPKDLTKPGFAAERAQLAAVYYPTYDQLEVFTVDPRGVLHVIWKQNNGSWQGPKDLTKPGFAPSGAPITVAYYPPNDQLEVFVVGHYGAVQGIWKEHNSDWNKPFNLTVQGLAPAGAAVAAVYYPQSNQQLYVFFVDSRNAVRAVSKAPDGRWGGATILSFCDFVSPSAAVSAVHYPEYNTLELLAVDRNGVINVIWRTPNADWNPPAALTPPAFASPGAPLVVVAYPLNSGQLELFTTNKSGVLHVLWKAQNNWWVPCSHPLEPVALANQPIKVLLTMRVGQLTGSIDPEGWTLLNGDTNHWGVAGTDLGANTEHNDRLYFFFGDVQKRDRRDGPDDNADLIAWTDTTQVATHVGHVAKGYNFVLPHDQTPVQGQRDWRFCGKCSSLFFDGYPDKGTCPKGGGHVAKGYNFVLPHDQTPVQGQRDWRFCGKCYALFYDGYADNKGVCPKDGIGHTPEGYNFVLPHDDAPVDDQRDWRFCGKCYALFYDGYPPFKGACSNGEGGGFHLHPVMNGRYFDPFTVERPIDVLLEDQTPTGAFSYGGRVYVFIWFGGRDLGEAYPAGSYLVSKVDPGQPGPYRMEFLITKLEGVQRGFWQVAPWVVHNADHPGLPNAEGDGVVLFGQGFNSKLRTDAVHLAWMPLRDSAPPRREEILYYTGESGNLWAPNQDQAVALFELRSQYTSVSAAWLEGPRLFILLYSKANNWDAFMASMVARIGTTPWNWSAEIELFNPCREHAYGKYMHWSGLDDINIRVVSPIDDAPARAYGAFLLNRFTKWNEATRELDLYYLLSLFRPYQVQVMHSRIHLL
jgi:hypothetical protein